MSDLLTFELSGPSARPAVRVLMFHPVLWSHYKAVVFSALQEICLKRGVDLNVVQVAETERGRLPLGEIDRSIHDYPHEILFDGAYDRISLVSKCVAVARSIFSRKWDIVIIFGYSDAAMWLAALLTKLRRGRVAVAIDSTEADRPRTPLRESIKRLLVSRCDLAFCYGSRSMDYVRTLGMSAQRIILRCQAADNNGIRAAYDEHAKDRTRLRSDLQVSRHNFIFVGRLSPEKNVELLIEAFIRIAHTVPDWGLLIVGDGPSRQQLERLVPAHLQKRVRFVGGKGWREIPRFYAAADVLVLPSNSEPWGLVVNEALVCGLPVIVSSLCGCVPELVLNGDTGFSFEPRNVDDLSHRMSRLAHDDALRAAMSRKGVEIIAGFTPAYAAQQIYNGIEILSPNAVRLRHSA